VSGRDRAFWGLGLRALFTQSKPNARPDATFHPPPPLTPTPSPTPSLIEERCVPMAWEADAPADLANQPKLAAFLPGGGGVAGAAAATSGAGRHAFFRMRRMQRVAAL
jgi:hypothetical protein